LNTNKHNPPEDERVRIAVIDTGVDIDAFTHSVPAGRMKEVWASEGVRAKEDTDGHGTHTASLIARIAPEAELYVARIAGVPSDDIQKTAAEVGQA